MIRWKLKRESNLNFAESQNQTYHQNFSFRLYSAHERRESYFDSNVAPSGPRTPIEANQERRKQIVFRKIGSVQLVEIKIKT